jgi:hypothetical protein
MSLIHTGEAHLAAGRLGEARRYAAQGTRGDQARAHQLRGEVASRGEPPNSKQALENYAVALSLAEELGMAPLQARCHLGLARLDRRTGTREQAQEHLATATAMYREMDMRFWLEKAEAETENLE